MSKDIRVPFLDLRVADEERATLLAAVDRVLRHGRIVLGPEVAAFEGALADYLGTPFAVGVNSGTDALILGLRALGIGPGDEVILPPLSFVASANAVSLVGATPVFADVGTDLTLDPTSAEALAGPRTRAIMPVHWAGLVCDMTSIMAIAERHGLYVIEDTSQAFGARLNGRMAGTFGDIGTFSMNCMKVLASLGEAGALCARDAGLREKLEVLRYHGLVNRETCVAVSHNGRLDTIQAAMLLERLRTFPQLVARRRDNAAFYDRQLAGAVAVPYRRGEDSHVFYTYTIQTGRRDGLKDYLAAHGIETKIQHLPLLPEQPVYADKVRGHWPTASRLMQQTLCLPVHEKLTPQQREYVAAKVLDFLERS